MKDWLRYSRNRLRMTAWSAYVTTDVLSMVRISQMIDQIKDKIITIFVFEYSWTQVISGGHGHCLTYLDSPRLLV